MRKMQRLAEVVTRTDATGAWEQLLVAFESKQERDDAAYDFDMWQLRHRAGERGSFRDISRDEARKRYDLRRLGVARYNVPVTIYDYRSGDPTAERTISGIEPTRTYADREAREAEAAMRRVGGAREDLEALLPVI